MMMEEAKPFTVAGEWQIMLYTLIGRLHQKEKQSKAPLLENYGSL